MGKIGTSMASAVEAHSRDFMPDTTDYRVLEVETPLLQALPDLQRRQTRSPAHALSKGVLQTRHGLVFGGAAVSDCGFVLSEMSNFTKYPA